LLPPDVAMHRLEGECPEDQPVERAWHEPTWIPALAHRVPLVRLEEKSLMLYI